jgi:putative peptide zinc metalloprotease protein
MQTDAPQLVPALRFVRQQTETGVSWVVKDATRQKYFRFGQVEVWLMQRMDGSRSVAQLCGELHEELGLRARPEQLEVLVRRLRELGLVERSLEERCALQLEQLRAQRRARRDDGNTMLRKRFSFGDPDPIMARTVAAAPFFWQPGFVVASAIAFSIYLVVLVTHWGHYITASTAIFDPARLTLPLFIMTYAIIVVVSIIHELGHGLTCKRFGGEVRELGAMLLYFKPAFYCNISDAWTFEKRSARLWTTFAGGWIELWIAFIALMVWLGTEPGTLINTLAAITSGFAGALGLLMNYNPLMPYDGYYALVDWLELPNLRQRSFGYLGAAVKRRVFRMNVELPLVTDRERRIFIMYGLGAVAYSAMVLSLIGFFVGRVLIRNFGVWGVLLFVLLLGLLTRKPRAAATNVVRAFVAEKLPRGQRQRAAVAALLIVVVLGVVSGFTPWTVQATAPVTVEPAARTWLRPQQSALLLDVRVRDGDIVRRGDTVAVLQSPELELARLRLLAEMHAAERRAATAAARGDAATARAAGVEHASRAERLSVIERSRAELVLLAPADATVATPLLYERLGETIAAGDSLIELWSIGAPRARIEATPLEGGEITAGSRVRIRFAAHPGLTWTSMVERVESAADADRIIAFAPLGVDAEHPLLPGMVGRARVDIQRTSISDALIRSARRLIRLDLFL